VGKRLTYRRPHKQDQIEARLAPSKTLFGVAQEEAPEEAHSCTLLAVSQTTVISIENRSEFERAGVIHVRRTLEASLYRGDKAKEAYEWLQEQERGPERALAAEQVSIAKDARDAAWAAARAAEAAAQQARRANITAIVALIITAAIAIAAIIVPLVWKPISSILSFE
jgi:hypothetical protein